MHRLKERVAILEGALLRLAGSEYAVQAALFLEEIQKIEQEHEGSLEFSSTPPHYQSVPGLRLSEERKYLELSLLPLIPVASPVVPAIQAFLQDQCG
jgi:hypothetical protein